MVDRIDRAASFLADDVVFAGPGGQLTGKAAYLAGLSAFAPEVTGVEFIAALGDDEQAALFYDTTTSSHGTSTFAERLVIRNGKIVSDRLIFDTNPAHAAGAPSQPGQ